MSRRYAVLLVVLFVAIDAAAFLFLRYRMSIPPDPPAEFATPAPMAEAVDENVGVIAGPLFLAGAPDGHVLRMTRGSCSEGEASTAWVAPPGADAADVPLPGGLVQTLGVGYDTDSERWWVVGADADCTVSAWSGGLEGTSWETSAVPAEAWYADPTDDTRLVTPRGALSLDSTCHATSAQVAGPNAYVVCADGRVLETRRDTREFSTLDIDAQVVAFAVRDDARAAAVTTGTDCLSGLSQFRSPAGASTGDTCFGNTKAGLGVAWVGEDLAVQVGFDLMTNDNGEWIERG